jgi:hypothetical protein
VGDERGGGGGGKKSRSWMCGESKNEKVDMDVFVTGADETGDLTR